MWALPTCGRRSGRRGCGGRTSGCGGERTGGGSWCGRRGTGWLAGKLDLHRDGYGFVRPNGSSSREDDLFIPPNELNGAMQGDEVLVDEAPPGRDGRRSGRVARVLTRRNPTVVGIFHYARARGDARRGFGSARASGWMAALVKGNYVTPLDERMGAPVLIPEGAEEVVRVSAGGARGSCAEARTRFARSAGAWVWRTSMSRWRGWRWMWRSRSFRSRGGRRRGA